MTLRLYVAALVRRRFSFRLVRNLSAIFAFLLFFSLFSPLFSFAAAPQTVITSDKLEYFSDTKKYVATGAVVIRRDGAVVHADEATYFEETSEVNASGHFTYDDSLYSIKADRADINMDTNMGKLFDAEVFFKKENTHLKGREIERRGENYYYSSEGSFTTCDAPIPAWCFRGKEINAYQGERLKASDASFAIKGLPVFYTPYLSAPLLSDRQTGLLMPILGNSSTRGAEILQRFYLVIDENRDATFAVDYYSKRGVGTGMEYRFIEPGGIKNNLWVYHIKDTVLDENDWEIRDLYENRHPDSLGGYLNINYVNQQDFFRVFNPVREINTQRFLESTGELNMPYSNSRLYLLSQYWVDLENPQGNVPQKLPEAGYVLNYTRMGSFMYSLSATAADLWRQNGVSAGRFDVYPRLLNSVGSDVVLTQAAAVRGTSYFFYNEQDADNSSQRGAFEYNVVAHTRLYRDYSSFTHVIEPSIGYHFISSSNNDLPVFDTTELFTKTSTIELGLLNRAIIKGVEAVAFRITQDIDTYNSERPFLPVRVDLAMKRYLPLALETTYNVYTGEIETLSSDIVFQLPKTTISVGQRYNREENILMYSGSVAFNPYESLRVAAQMWYDAKGTGLQNLDVSVRYLRQCWGVRLEAVKNPGDFTVRVLFSLSGLHSKTAAAETPAQSRPYF
jgi:LPS-assembly protein